VEQFERIRRDGRDEGLSVRALAVRYGVHRRTVRAALADATPPARKTPSRSRPVLGAYEATIRDWLIKDKGEPRKQAAYRSPGLAAAGRGAGSGGG